MRLKINITVLLILLSARLGFGQNSFYLFGQVDFTFTTEQEGPMDINSLYYYEYAWPGSVFYDYKTVLLTLENAPATYTIAPSAWLGIGARLFDTEEAGGNLELLFGKLAYATYQSATYKNQSAIFTTDFEEWRWKFRLLPYYKIQKFTLRGGLGFSGGFAKQIAIGLSLPTSGLYGIYPSNTSFQKRDFSFLASLGASYALSKHVEAGFTFETFSITSQKEALGNSNSFLQSTGYEYHRFRCFSFGVQVQYTFWPR